jgi:hypothetical protein
MTAKIVFELTETEAAALTNALNYVCNACSPEECSTLTGMEQKDAAALLDRLLGIAGKQ